MGNVVKQIIENKKVNAYIQIIGVETTDQAIKNAETRGKAELTVRTYPTGLKGIMEVEFDIPFVWKEKYNSVYFFVTGYSTPRIAQNFINKSPAKANSDLGSINEKKVFLLVKHL